MGCFKSVSNKEATNKDDSEVTDLLLDGKPERRVSVAGMTVIIFCSVTGAGILGIPFALESVGWGLGLILLSTSAFVSTYGLFLITEICLKLQGRNMYLYYGSVASLIDKKYLPIVCDWLVIITLSVLCVMYSGITADFVEHSFEYFNPEGADRWYQSRTFFLTVTYLVWSTPMSYLESFNKLQYSSYIGAFIILYVVVLIVVYAFLPLDYVCQRFLVENEMDTCEDASCCVANATSCCVGEIVAFNPSYKEIFYAWPIMITAFGCAASFFKVLNDLVEPTRKRINLSATVTITVKFFMDVSISVAAIFTYGSNISPDILSSYPLDGPITAARLGVALLVALTFPILFQPVRASLMHFIQHCWNLKHGVELTKETNRKLHYIVTTVMLVLIYVAAYQDIQLTVLLNFIGAITVGNLVFALPAFFYLKIIEPTNVWRRASCYFLIFWSLFLSGMNISIWATST